MSDRNNRQDVNRRVRNSSAANNARPQARKFSSSASQSQSEFTSRQTRSSKTVRSSKASKIPKLTTTSGQSIPYTARATQPQDRSQRQSATQRRSQAQASGRSQTQRQYQAQGKYQGRVQGQAKRGPQQRTPSSANAFVNFTKQHIKVMGPVLVLVALLIIYTIVDLGASIGRIHPGVSVQGVDVGGLTVEQASTKLSDELSPTLSSAQVTIYKDEKTARADGAMPQGGTIEKAYADEAAGSDTDNDGSVDKWLVNSDIIGAYIDGDALAEKAYLVGREGNFVAQRFSAWFGGVELPAVPAVSEERFNTLMTEINSEIGRPIVESLITISNGLASVQAGEDGWAVNEPLFIELYGQAAFDPNAPYYVIPMQTDPMHIHPETAQKVAQSVTSAISEDVTIMHDPDTWIMDPTDLGDIISQQVLAPGEVLTFGNGTQKVVTDTDAVAYRSGIAVDPESGYSLQAYVNQERADSWLVGILGPLATGGAENAWFDTSSGTDVILVEAVIGYGPDRASAELELQNLLFGEPDTQTTKDRTIVLVDGPIEPELTTEKAQAMGITERLATWTIPLSGTADRINNLKLLCSMIDHSFVAPGETWSFNNTTGERTAEKGFKTAPVIINGKHEDQLGGGICQIATCVYNCACFSGLGIQERVNHDFYIASYDDEGFNDATVSWKSPDLKFVNDMNTYVLLTANVTDENVVVSFWGTKDGRTVECQRGEWRPGDKYVAITEVDNEKPVGYRAITQQGVDGRAIDIRYLCKAADGTVLHDILFHSIYSAQNEITTIGPTAPPPAEPADTGADAS